MKKLGLAVIAVICSLEWAQAAQSLKTLPETFPGGWRMLTDEEIAQHPEWKAHDMTGKLPKPKTLPPDEWSWRNKDGHDWMTSVKHQHSPQHCGACWAFGTISALEARYKIANNLPNDLSNPDFSEQFLVSCCTENDGCGGGALEPAAELVANMGIPDEACYPYKARDRTSGAPCSDRCNDWESRVVKAIDWNYIRNPSDLDCKTKIMEGPVNAGVISLVHAMCLYGWTSSGKWLYKNSWGTGNQPYVAISERPVVIAWVVVKSDTGTPIIWTTDSLNFVFGVKGVFSPSANLESILHRGEHILKPSQIKNTNESSESEDTLQYDDPGEGLEDWYGRNYFGVRFTPPRQCNVIAGLVGRMTKTQAKNDRLIVRDDASGNPGTTIEEVPYTTQTGTSVIWYRQNLSTPYSDDNDFWLTYYAETDENSSYFMSDGTGGSRSYHSANGSSWDQHSADFLIRAIVTYEGEYATIWVKNVGAGKLTVSNVNASGGSGWISSISPKNFNVYGSDSAGIEIAVDTSGLQKDVLHQDEIVVTSNSGKTENRVPVSLFINSQGIAEKKESMSATFKLSPNPFRDKVGISYFVPEKANVKLVVRDIAGREVAKIVDRVENTGIKKIEWDTKNIPAGVYFCRLTIENSETIRRILWTRKVLLVK